MELELTTKRLLRIWWAYFWRSVVTMLGAMLISGIIGFFAALILQIFGVSLESAQLPLQVLGGAIGLVMTIIPIQLMLENDFGEFRLVLRSNDDALPAQATDI